MCDTGYTVKALARDLLDFRQHGAGEAQLLAEAPDLVKRLMLMKHNWLRARMAVPAADPGNGPARFVLHEEPDHTLAIFVVTMGPGESTPPHDHGTWAVIAGLEGRETNRWWKRATGDAVIASGEENVDAGTILTVPAGAIHSVHNESGTVCVTLQVYGTNPEHTPHRNYETRRPS